MRDDGAFELELNSGLQFLLQHVFCSPQFMARRKRPLLCRRFYTPFFFNFVDASPASGTGNNSFPKSGLNSSDYCLPNGSLAVWNQSGNQVYSKKLT